MYNEDIPTRAELPSTRQLIRSTVIAFVAAIVILLTIVLPSEYGLDPTGAGGVLGLTEMGEIKTQLSNEAEADRLRDQKNQAPSGDRSSLLNSVVSLFSIRSAAAQTTMPEWKETYSLTLTPGQGAEVKLVMAKGATAAFTWSAKDGVANFDLHGDGGGKSISYKKGRGVAGGEGLLKAAFDGNHGWFWRNRTKRDITIILKVRGDYSELKRVL